MSGNGYVQLAFYLVVLTVLAKPLGGYMARVYEGGICGLDRLLGGLEHRPEGPADQSRRPSLRGIC